MNYGFVIDQRKCIGCHACTVACKSEHDVPLGVYRTHVKYVERGVFPATRRFFSIHRCNHCENAPCVEICPTSALFARSDGIVDFDRERCIGCKACMHACPYDALYIDPETRTAAKCNYCAHRLDRGYEPACVIVCPVEAIVSGDLDEPTSRIGRLVGREKTSVRKADKNTVPNVYYIDGDHASLTAAATDRLSEYVFTDQKGGVGHHAPGGDGAADQDLLLTLAMEANREKGFPVDERAIDEVSRALEREARSASRRVQDAPSKGVLWGWEVTAYIWTKAIAAGTFMMTYAHLLAAGAMPAWVERAGLAVTLVFLGLTTALLVKDLDRPDRFLYVLLRPNWSSWLARGGYILSAFGGVATLMLIGTMAGVDWIRSLLFIPGLALAALAAMYTAFLFAQAKGRDLWQSPLGAVKMLAHSVIGGSTVVLLMTPSSAVALAFTAALAVNLLVILIEVYGSHGSVDAARAADMMRQGRHAHLFQIGAFIGTVAPLLLVAFDGGIVGAGILALAGMFLTEFVWIRVPQLIPLD